MGGSAFSSHDPPLPTPRMPLEIYEQVLYRMKEILNQYYAQVDSPIEAPGKTTFGDVDMLVTGALSDDFDPAKTTRSKVADHLMRVLDAAACIRHSANPTINLAVPWLVARTTSSNDNDKIPFDQEPRYVQIDIHYLPTPESFRWELFHSAHGDMWNILGSTIRRFGLTVNDRGLYLRIPEIELLDRKKSLIFLTDDPSEVLEFLGLDENKWWQSFRDQEEMFEYAAGNRMFWVRAEETEEREFDVIGHLAGQEGGEAGKKKLKHNDRQRMSKRPIFNAWINEFIPRCREQGRYTEQKITREEIRDDAFDKFAVQEEYQERLMAWNLLRHQDEVWREAIKGSVPIDDVDPQIRAAAIKVIKGVVMEGGEFEDGVPEKIRPNKQGFYDIGAVKEFVLANWARAGTIGMERQQARAMQVMKEKAEKKRLLAEQDSKGIIKI